VKAYVHTNSKRPASIKPTIESRYWWNIIDSRHGTAGNDCRCRKHRFRLPFEAHAADYTVLCLRIWHLDFLVSRNRLSWTANVSILLKRDAVGDGILPLRCSHLAKHTHRFFYYAHSLYLCENMSSIKPEEHSISYCRQWRSSHGHRWHLRRKMWWNLNVWYLRKASWQTDRTHIHADRNTLHPYREGGEVRPLLSVGVQSIAVSVYVCPVCLSAPAK